MLSASNKEFHNNYITTNKQKQSKNKNTMALSVKGRVVATPPPVSSEYNGKTFCKQTVVLECGEEEPYEVAFEFDPDRKADAATLREGEQVEISFKSVSYESKKQAGTYFTTNRLLRVNFLSPRPTQTPAPAQAAAPQAAQATIAAPAAAAADDSDSLPF